MSCKQWLQMLWLYTRGKNVLCSSFSSISGSYRYSPGPDFLKFVSHNIYENGQA